MPIYQKKPERVEALKVGPETASIIAHWCGGRMVEENNPFPPYQSYVGVNVPTMKGVERAQEGDYVVQTPLGAFEVIKEKQFEAIYEEV